MSDVPEKILHIITNFESPAGAERALINLINAELSKEALIVSLKANDIVNSPSLFNKTPDVIALNNIKSNPLRGISQLNKIYSDYDPDLVICWMYHANVMAAAAKLFYHWKTPLYWTVHHDLADISNETRSTMAAIALSSCLARVANSIIYVSEKSYIQHKNYFKLSRHSKIIPNAIDFPNENISNAIDCRGTPYTVGFAARYHPTKGFETFLSVVKLVRENCPHIQFIACGNNVTYENSELMSIINARGLDEKDIKLLGQISNMEQFYNKINLLLMTSKSEGFGMVLAEAMGRNIPFVSTDVGIASMIAGETGRVLPVDDINGIAQALIRIYETQGTNQKEAICKDGTRIREIFGKNAVRQKYIDLILSD